MPHKRSTRLQHNLKNQVPHRLRVATGTAPPPLPQVSVKSNHGSEIENTVRDEPEQPKSMQALGHQFAVPQYNTTIRKHDEIAVVQNMRVVVGPELTPRTKAVIAPKVTQKMNFPPNRAIFKDLTPINVNDTLGEHERPRTNLVKSKGTGKRVVEPQLIDYLEKIECVQILVPEPELQMEFPNEDYDFLLAYRKLYN